MPRKRLVLYSSLAVAVLLGLVIGLGSFTFVYAKGYSYLQDDPAVCANCHVMQDHYSAWLRSSHRNVATCNDCHTPHDSVISKYIVKGKNGFWHSFYFTTGTYPDPIRITPGNRTVTEGACRYCHGALVEAMDGGHHGADDVSCIRCHATVGHDPNR